jgi:proteasome lid subunit RPN8/RPN11
MDLKDQMKVLALRECPKEACGFVLSKGDDLEVVGVPNVAEIPQDYFRIDPQTYLRFVRMGKVKAYWHSHPRTDAVMSDADKAVAERMQLPLYVYSVTTDKMDLYVPTGYQVPLIGRPFVFGVFDCIGLVLDYYHQVLKIEIEDIPRTSDEIFKGFQKIAECARNRGFLLVDSLKTHDIIVMKIGRAEYCNHFGVITDKEMMLHQLMERSSAQVVYGGFWKRQTEMILRHRTQL